MFGFEFQFPVRIISSRPEFNAVRTTRQHRSILASHRSNYRRGLVVTRIEHNLDLNEIGYPDLALRGFTHVVGIGEFSGFALIIYESGSEPTVESMIFEIVSREISVPIVVARWCSISRIVIPPAQSEMIMSSRPPIRPAPLRTSVGVNLLR